MTLKEKVNMLSVKGQAIKIKTKTKFFEKLLTNENQQLII